MAKLRSYRTQGVPAECGLQEHQWEAGAGNEGAHSVASNSRSAERLELQRQLVAIEPLRVFLNLAARRCVHDLKKCTVLGVVGGHKTINIGSPAANTNKKTWL